MTHYRFEQVTLKGTRRWTENGRKRQETQTFMQTINPFNKNAAGEVKGYAEILAELMAERTEWLAAEKWSNK